VKNCGGCGRACPQASVCTGGGCNCMMCNVPNAWAICPNGQCVLDKCYPGFADCNQMANDGCEANVGRDRNNCGQCGKVCPQNLPSCVSAQCTAQVDNPDPLSRCKANAVAAPIMMPMGAKWANSLVAFSSQYSQAGWSAMQTLGAPNTYPSYGDLGNAWATQNAEGVNEFLTVGFPQNTTGSQVWVVETYNPDAVKSVTVTTANGANVVYTNPKPATVGGCAYILMVPTSTNLAITQVRIDLAAELVPGWNEIDAVGIVP
jgi:hypothetical protein